jgi:hypothetical protein
VIFQPKNRPTYERVQDAPWQTKFAWWFTPLGGWNEPTVWLQSYQERTTDGHNLVSIMERRLGDGSPSYQTQWWMEY